MWRDTGAVCFMLAVDNIVSLQNQGCRRSVPFVAERPGLHSCNEDDLQL